MSNEELYYILMATGVALEGYVYIGNKSRSDIAFINTDPAVRNFYINVCNALHLNPRIYGKRISVHNYYLAQRMRQDIYYNDSLKKLPPGIEKYPVEVLRWAFTLEGGVVLGSDPRNDEIIFRSTSPIILKQIADLLRLALNENPGIRGTLIYLKRQDLVLKFARIIGFLPAAKAVRGKYKGIEKNKLLQIMISRHNLTFHLTL